MTLPDDIAREFATAVRARREGNEGMVRVCARRAAGLALGYWLERHPQENWSPDAMGRLRRLQNEGSVPLDVRAAAGRLSSRVTADFASPHPNDPVEDARVIVNHFLRKDTP